MSPYELYKSRAVTFGLDAERLGKRANRLSFARLAVFISGLALFVILSSVSVFIAVTALVISMCVFVWLIIFYDKTEKQKERCRHLETINSLEVKCLDGDFSTYRDGREYMERDHPYSFDLDIFGHASLFQYINRTTSKPASDILARYLKSHASIEEIRLRQKAVTDLNPKTDWRQELMTLGYINSSAGADPAPLMRWLAGEEYFGRPKHIRLITYFFSSAAILSLIMVILGSAPALLVSALIINFIVYFAFAGRTGKLHQKVSRSSDLLKCYSSTIGLIENEDFQAAKLRDLKSAFINDISASAAIHKLAKLVNRLDSRMNILVSIPLNTFFFADIHFCLALEEWKRRFAKKIPLWFESMAEFEVLSSLGNLSFNNPGWTMPEIVPGYFTFNAANMGHPLIPSDRRICNDLVTSGTGKTILITGSNMSGKSTFLRTLGVTSVLAMAGAPVCASSLTMSHVQIYSSMRISDSLEDNISSFYAELRRLRTIITEAENNPRLFLLLDEILRGTNSNDRFTGSVALIRQLSDYGTISVVATHDLKLAELSGELAAKIENYHFDVRISDEELFFDYRLTPGICTSLNASLLMKKMGIRV